ncbi:MAG: phenylacetic acid degradation protein paaN [Motiliproteus sp.]|jgi:phenylacetic acid degradation protein paaN
MQVARSFFDKHRENLDKACQAVITRECWSLYPEVPSGRIYGETANQEGKNAFQARLGKPFSVAGPTSDDVVSSEISPYTGELEVSYSRYEASALVGVAAEAMPAWRDAGPELRTGVCLEILERLNLCSFEMAYAVMHTTGQGFAMAFQAGGPHAQDRGLEAVACTWQAMSRIPSQARWSKPQGQRPPLVMDKRFHIVPRGVALVIACSTFPTWNTYPGLFASLVAGNPVIIKPHPQAVLPVAISVEVAQRVLAEAGFDPRLVMLAADDEERAMTRELATHPRVRLIDYTGGNLFGEWLSNNARQAQLYKEQAGINSVLIDSVDNIDRVAQNLAFSLSLYSGQMCTSPQALLIPRDGVRTADGVIPFDRVAELICVAISGLLSDPERAVGVLGAIPSEATRARLAAAVSLGEVVLASACHPHPLFEDARYCTPLVLKVNGDAQAWRQEQFGPIVFLVEVESTDQGMALVAETVACQGAITLGVYTTDEQILERTERLAIDQGVALSCNLDGGVFVNQSAAFSDFHATGNNPAANAAITDPAFVAGRFAVVQSRRHAPQC